MKTFFNLPPNVSEQYVFLDNDFLSKLFSNPSIFKEFSSKFQEGYILNDPMVEFEFLRDIYIPEQRKLKREFLDLPLFGPVINHQEVFVQIQENALLLSRIYAHENQKGRSSLVDLLLAARIMLNPTRNLLFTGNKKDFPSTIFNLIGTIDVEQNDDSVQAYSLLEFDVEKFDSCLEKLDKTK